jgi:hypothetical protein
LLPSFNFKSDRSSSDIYQNVCPLGITVGQSSKNVPMFDNNPVNLLKSVSSGFTIFADLDPIFHFDPDSAVQML